MQVNPAMYYYKSIVLPSYHSDFIIIWKLKPPLQPATISFLAHFIYELTILDLREEFHWNQGWPRLESKPEVIFKVPILV